MIGEKIVSVVQAIYDIERKNDTVIAAHRTHEIKISRPERNLIRSKDVFPCFHHHYISSGFQNHFIFLVFFWQKSLESVIEFSV